MLKRLVLAPVHFYRAVISPALGPRCRFHPTCSAYAVEAVEKHGAGKGLILAVLRLAKCHPWHKGDWHNPVPERFAWKPFLFYKRNNPE